MVGVEKKTDAGADVLLVRLDNDNFKATLRVWLLPGDFYLRKQITLTAKHTLTLEELDVESLQTGDATQPYTENAITANAPGNWRPNLGQPLYGDKTGTFWGIEFPAAINRVKDGVLLCGYQYGREMKPGESLQSYPAVMGVSDDLRFNQDAFFDYIDRVRVRPFHLQTQYNCWFDWGGAVDAAKFAESVSRIHRELVEKRGVRPISAYVIDDGWQDTSVSWENDYWPVNKKFDADFASSFRVVGGHNPVSGSGSTRRVNLVRRAVRKLRGGVRGASIHACHWPAQSTWPPTKSA